MNMLPVGDGTAQVERWGGQYLIVQLQAESFGVDITAVREIIAYVVPTQIPMMPTFVVGVINLRGQVVPIIDIARRFGRPATAIHKRSCIIIVDLLEGESRQRLGVIVDAVNEVLEFSGEQIEPAPQFGAGLRTEFIRGMAKVANQFIVLLEMERVLSLDEMAELAAIAADAAAGP
ncbi:MAG: chemotaxis protein CheW [Acidithiobacillus sp.]|jgi:purine-binding chemotaxis protein CheW|uniref:chemotaxis protein CheW n=1 Tax=Acidithiobacillus TaxID=119977 RepID=UPI000AC0261C|nr:chemotaxis protein CheW [Acidithiobacillus ferrooxidans]